MEKWSRLAGVGAVGAGWEQEEDTRYLLAVLRDPALCKFLGVEKDTTLSSNVLQQRCPRELSKMMELSFI